MLLRQLGELHILVLQSPDDHLLHATYELPEGRRSRHIAAQHQCVYKEALNVIELASVAPGRQGPDCEVLLPGVAMQHAPPSRQKGHKQGTPLATTELPQLSRQG